MDKFYIFNVDGYCGDEDNGQILVWYVFFVMGFYFVCFGMDQYVMGMLYFKQMKLYLENGKIVQISVLGNSDENCYIVLMIVNGKILICNYLIYKELMNGVKIMMKMLFILNKQCGVCELDFLYLFFKEVC